MPHTPSQRCPSKSGLGIVSFKAGSSRAFAVKVEGKRLLVSPFSGFDLYHHFRNDAFYDLYNLLKVRKPGKQDVVSLQPLPQTLYNLITVATTLRGLTVTRLDV